MGAISKAEDGIVSGAGLLVLFGILALVLLSYAAAKKLNPYAPFSSFATWVDTTFGSHPSVDSFLGEIGNWLHGVSAQAADEKAAVAAAAPERAAENAENDQWFSDYWAGSAAGDTAASIFANYDQEQES